MEEERTCSVDAADRRHFNILDITILTDARRLCSGLLLTSGVVLSAVVVFASCLHRQQNFFAASSRHLEAPPPSVACRRSQDSRCGKRVRAPSTNRVKQELESTRRHFRRVKGSSSHSIIGPLPLGVEWFISCPLSSEPGG
jgi:hypothetical protein